MVRLWAVAGAEDTLCEYEDAVLPLLADHGGCVVVRLRHTEPGDGPNETHVLVFPDEAALDAYLTDPQRAALAEARDACIARTELSRVEML